MARRNGVGCVSRPRRIRTSPTSRTTHSNQTVTYFPYGISFKNSKELTRAGKIGENPGMKQMRVGGSGVTRAGKKVRK